MQSTSLYRAHVICGRGGGGDPARAENEVCVGSTRLSLRAENWRNRGDGISRKQRVLVSFSRNKGSSFPKLSPCLCINHRHAGKCTSLLTFPASRHVWHRVDMVTGVGSLRGLKKKTCLAVAQFHFTAPLST